MFAEEILRDVAATKPSLVVHDLFAVIGCAVANRLDLPRVSVCAGHHLAPQRLPELLQHIPNVRPAPECLRAVEVLRDSCGIAQASPFYYVSALSPLLNLYGEPPEFLTEEERRPFAPLAFFGSIPTSEDGAGGARKVPTSKGARRGRPLNVFVCFGTVIWRYFTADAVRALAALIGIFAGMDNVRATVSLGRANLDAAQLAALAQPNVSIESYVDQWRLLREADAFITHHGLNSTHEAIFHRVPMISYPFFWDQPSQAARCQEFGLAVPLVSTLRGPIGDADVHAALGRIAADGGAMQGALARARQWELAVIANRPAVLQQLVDLMA